jgi:hypothetical protein
MTPEDGRSPAPDLANPETCRQIPSKTPEIASYARRTQPRATGQLSVRPAAARPHLRRGPVVFACPAFDVTPALEQRAAHRPNTRIRTVVRVLVVREHLCGSAAVRGGEVLVPGREYERLWVRRGVLRKRSERVSSGERDGRG